MASAHTVSVALGLHHLPFTRGMDAVLRQTSAATRLMDKLDRKIRGLGRDGPDAPFIQRAARGHAQLERMASQQERLRSRALAATSEYNNLQRRSATATDAHDAKQLARRARLTELVGEESAALRARRRLEDDTARRAKDISTAREKVEKDHADRIGNRHERLAQLRRRQEIIDRGIEVQRMRHDERIGRMKKDDPRLAIERRAMHARELRAADATARVTEATARARRDISSADDRRARELGRLDNRSRGLESRHLSALERNQKRIRGIERERSDLHSKIARSTDAHGAQRARWLEREALLTERLNGLDRERVNLERTRARQVRENARLDRQARSATRIARADRFGRAAGRATIGAGLLAGAGAVLAGSFWTPGKDLIERELFLQLSGVGGDGGPSMGDVRRRVDAMQKAVPTVDTVRALELFGETRGLFGAKKALDFLPMAARVESMAKVIGGPGFDFRSTGRVLDALGATGDKDRTEKIITMMMKSYLLTEGQVRPETFQQVVKYARGAKFAMSDEFIFKVLPGLMTQYITRGGGGGGRGNVGTMVAAFSRGVVEGTYPKRMIPTLAAYKLFEDDVLAKYGSDVPTGTPLRGADLASENPFAWSRVVMMPAIKEFIRKQGGETFRGKKYSVEEMEKPENEFVYRNVMSKHIRRILSTRLAQNLGQDLSLTVDEIIRDLELLPPVFREMGGTIQGVYGWMLKHHPGMKTEAVIAQFETARQKLGKLIVPRLILYLDMLTTKLQALNEKIENDPEKVDNWIDNIMRMGKALAYVAAVGATLWTASKIVAFGEALLSVTAVGGLATLGATLSAVAVGLLAVAAAAGVILYATDEKTRDSVNSRAAYAWSAIKNRGAVAAANFALANHNVTGIFGMDEEWKAEQARLRAKVTEARLHEAMSSFEYYQGFQEPQSGGPRNMVDPATALFMNATQPPPPPVVNNYVEVKVGDETVDAKIERQWQELERGQTSTPSAFNLGRDPQVTGPGR